MNDFREYSAAFMDHQNELMHYGVKGMKWKHHIRRLQEITGIGLKREIKNSREATLASAKAELENRLKANDPYLRKDIEMAWEMHKGGPVGRGSMKDFHNYNADEAKIYRKKFAYDTKKAQKAYDKSLLGKLERQGNILKDTLKSASLKDYKDFYGNLFKKKKKKK